MFRCQNIISLVPRDWSLFIAWEGEGAIGGDHLIFRRTKGGSVVTQKGRSLKLWKDHGRGGTTQVCLDGFMKKKGPITESYSF